MYLAVPNKSCIARVISLKQKKIITSAGVKKMLKRKHFREMYDFDILYLNL